MSSGEKHISPFKFLDSYGLEDRDQFFGRKKEVDDLYAMVKQSKLALIYGLSGTGKTSLVNCGLASRFSENTWYPVLVRRGQNLNDSLDFEIRQKAIEPIDKSAGLPEKIESIYLDYYVPIYLIFDQFEELFISGTTDEQLQFFNQLAELYNSKVSVRILIIMREEYLGYFSNFERILPELFENRFRVEKMNQSQLGEVIEGTFEAADLKIEAPERMNSAILENVRDERKEIDLTNLQVYFDRMWQTATKDLPENQSPIFSPALVEKVGKLPQVLSTFLDEQLQEIAKKSGDPTSKIPLEILSKFVTDDGTKQNRTLADLKKSTRDLKLTSEKVLNLSVEEFERRKIVREIKIGERVEYELAHDLLAAQIFNRFSAAERNRREAKNRYLIYEKIAEDRLLVKAELETLVPFLSVLKPPQKLAEIIEKSREEVEGEERRERSRLEQALKRQKCITMAVVATSIAFLALAGFAFFQWQSTQKAKHEISIKAFEAQMNLSIAEKNEGNYSEALVQLASAEDFAVTTEQISKVNQSKTDWNQLKKLTKEAADFAKNKDFLNAVNKLNEAQKISPDDRISELIRSNQTALNEKFNDYIRAAEAMIRAKELGQALDNYENALQLKPEEETRLRPLIERLK